MSRIMLEHKELINLLKSHMELIYIIITGLLSLGGVWLGSLLSKRQAKAQSLTETKMSIYGRLLSAIRSEDNYPPDIAGTFDIYSDEKIAEYNKKIKEWRKNRNMIRGLAAEALLVTRSETLRDKLSIFISSKNPDDTLRGIEGLMRDEIKI